jgi:serine/threonine protein kinase
MVEISSQSGHPLSLDLRINAALNRFEQAWKTGQRPRIEEFLGDAPEPVRSALLRELIALDIEYRRQAGEQPQAADYHVQFPSLDPAQVGAYLEPQVSTVPRTTLPAELPRPAIPGYEVLGELGQGGQSIVYQAWQTSLQRFVAVKMLLAGVYASTDELKRFQIEAEAAARLQHPHIVQIYEIGQLDQHPYMSLEYVEGGSLAKQLQGNPLPAQQAAQWLATLARAVHYAHQRGIVHRDLKPSNVLLAPAQPPDGLPLSGVETAGTSVCYVPKITDFGLAKLLVGGGRTLTQSGHFLGTPSYTAPEQAAGKTKAIGPATDVYALGAILYELLTGRPPFKAESAEEILDQVRWQEPVSPSRLRPKLARDLTTICLKCLEKEPGKRYATAEALADDLQRFLAGETIRARPVGRTEKLWRWCRRNPVVATLATAIVLLLGALTSSSLIQNVQLSAANREAKERLWESFRERARALRMSRHAGQRVESLRSIQQAMQLPLPPGRSLDELRTEAIAALALPDLERVRECDVPAGSVGGDFDGIWNATPGWRSMGPLPSAA